MATMSLEMIEEIRGVARAFAEGEKLRFERLRAAQAQVEAAAPRTNRRGVRRARS